MQSCKIPSGGPAGPAPSAHKVLENRPFAQPPRFPLREISSQQRSAKQRSETFLRYAAAKSFWVFEGYTNRGSFLFYFALNVPRS